MSSVLLQEVDLGRANTLQLPCVARQLLRVDSEAALIQAVTELDLHPERVFVLGGGSNVLLPERLQRTVIQPCMSGIDLVRQHADQVEIAVGAGLVWDDLVAHTVARGWHGLENLSAIPGSVGAAPVQNIGAYGVELADLLTGVEAYDLNIRRSIVLSRDACEFGYRDSLFKRQPSRYVILRVHLRLSTTAVFHLDYGPLQALRQRPGLSQAEVRQRVRLIRAAKLPDPSIQPNVGSFFKNPRVDAAHWQVLRMRFPDLVSFPVDASGGRKLAAGWLIERAGWKGVSRQGVTVHPLQALVLINSGQARRQDVQTLADAICVSVWRCFGVALEREPVWVD